MMPWAVAAIPAGGVPPSPTAVQHQPPGGGMGQLIKDTFAPTAAAPDDDTNPSQDTNRRGDSSSSGGGDDGGGYNRQQGVQGTDLSEVLPSDEAMVYGGEGLLNLARPLSEVQAPQLLGPW